VPADRLGVLVYGVYEFVQPSQPLPGNVFWAWILGIVLVAAVATAVFYLRGPGALPRGHVRSGIHRAGRPGPRAARPGRKAEDAA
jgi:hypothetical protein